MKRSTVLFLLALLLHPVLMAQLPTVATGTLRRIEAFPSKYVDARHVDVWLPEGYPSAGRYAVLYMHDGQMLFDSTVTWNKQEWRVDETAGRLQREGKTIPFIVVGVHNNGRLRFAEYFPSKAIKAMGKEQMDSLAAEIGGRDLADNYLRFLVEELKPYIDQNFATHQKPKYTFLAGSSMGGLISLYGLGEYPKVFGGSACLSTHWPGSLKHLGPENSYFRYIAIYTTWRFRTLKSKLLYFDHGDGTLDSFYPSFQKDIDGTAAQYGLKAPRYSSRFFPGADHSERAWAARLEEPLLFLLGKR